MSFCRSCSAPVMWAKTETGKLMPVDEDPVPDGNIDLPDLQTPGKLTAVVRAAGYQWPAETPRFVSHFVTCPQQREWRRK